MRQYDFGKVFTAITTSILHPSQPAKLKIKLRTKQDCFIHNSSNMS